MTEYDRLFDDIEASLWPVIVRNLKVHRERASMEADTDEMKKHRKNSRSAITSMHTTMSKWAQNAPQPIMEWEMGDD